MKRILTLNTRNLHKSQKMAVVANVKHLANLLARHLVELPTKNVLAKKKINRKKLTLFTNLLTYM